MIIERARLFAGANAAASPLVVGTRFKQGGSLAASDSLPAHLLIGSDAVRFAAEAEKARAAEGAQWRD